MTTSSETAYITSEIDMWGEIGGEYFLRGSIPINTTKRAEDYIQLLDSIQNDFIQQINELKEQYHQYEIKANGINIRMLFSNITKKQKLEIEERRRQAEEKKKEEAKQEEAKQEKAKQEKVKQEEAEKEDENNEEATQEEAKVKKLKLIDFLYKFDRIFDEKNEEHRKIRDDIKNKIQELNHPIYNFDGSKKNTMNK